MIDGQYGQWSMGTIIDEHDCKDPLMFIVYLLMRVLQIQQNELSRLPAKQAGSKNSKDDIYEQISGTWVVILIAHFEES